MTWADMSLLSISERGQGEKEEGQGEGLRGNRTCRASSRRQSECRPGVRGAQASSHPGWTPALLSPSNPWVVVASMESAGPFQPPSAENILGALTRLASPSTLTAFLAGAELIPHSSVKPELGLIVIACG